MAGATQPLLSSFYFEVIVAGFPPSDYAFKEVSGISAKREVVEIGSGGLPYAYKVPGKIQYGELTLKRGIVTASSPLTLWCLQTIQSSLDAAIVPQELSVLLMNEKGLPAMTWNFKNAWPKEWQVSDLNSTASGEATILIETLTFVYESFIAIPA